MKCPGWERAVKSMLTIIVGAFAAGAGQDLYFCQVQALETLRTTSSHPRAACNDSIWWNLNLVPPTKRPSRCTPSLIIQRGDESVGYASNPLDGSLSLQRDCRLETLGIGWTRIQCRYIETTENEKDVAALFIFRCGLLWLLRPRHAVTLRRNFGVAGEYLAAACVCR